MSTPSKTNNPTNSPSSTPTKLRQVTLRDYLARTPERGLQITQAVAGTSTGCTGSPSIATNLTTTPTRSSPHSGPNGSGGKRRNPVNTPSSSTPTKRQQRQTQVGKSPSTRRASGNNRSTSRNEDNLDESNDDLTSSSGTGNEACDGDEDDDQRETAQHFSIHRLPVDSLRIRFRPNLSEMELIKEIMQEINEKLKTENKTEFENKEGSLPSADTNANGASEDDISFGYQVLVYVQKLEHRDDFLANFKVNEKTIRLNKIVFYHRVGDIYALTIGPTWQATQAYSCYNFPCQISGRLTSTEGNTQEIAMHLTGNVRVSTAIKKNPTLFDKLKTVIQNAIKPLREDCSLYRLKEFRNTTDNQVKLQIGLAYVRIKKRMDLKNLPEILDHFTKICNGENTRRVPDGNIEIETNDFPYIHGVSGEEASEAENSLYELIRQFMHNENVELIKKFDIVDKYKDDFYNAEGYKLTYQNKGSTYKELADFRSCPTAFQIFSAIRENCGTEITGNDVSQQYFTTRMKKYIKIEYTVKGRKEPVKRQVMDLLEGEMSLHSTDYWRLMGRWLVVRDDYYYRLHREFLDFLKTDKKVFFTDPSQANLSKSWNDGNIRSVKDYCKLYETERGYYLPPGEPEMEEMSSQPLESNASDTEVETFSSRREMEGNHFFDMMKISQYEDGKFAFYLYYIFDRFDAGIRDASTRIAKSIEILLNDSPTAHSMSLLEKFWSYNFEKSKTFRKLFPDFEMFRNPLTTEQVRVVVAFATQNEQLSVPASPGTLLNFARPDGREGDSIPTPTLKREQSLRLELTLEVLSNLLENIESEHLNTMCKELEIPLYTDTVNHNFDDMTKKVWDRLVDNGYFVSGGPPAEVTGKLLKLRNHFNFRIFQDRLSNQKLFKELRSLFITGFPGFIHKLECLQIYENVTKMVRLKLHVVEI